jgi:hypothetical protein
MRVWQSSFRQPMPRFGDMGLMEVFEKRADQNLIA